MGKFFKVSVEFVTILLLSSMLGFFGHKSYSIFASQPGIELPCPALEDKVLIIGRPGRCHSGFKPLGMRHLAIVFSVVDRNMNLCLQKPN